MPLESLALDTCLVSTLYYMDLGKLTIVNIMKASVRALSDKVLSPEEFDEALWISITYKQNRLSSVEKFLEIDKKVGIPLPTHTHYNLKYRGVIRTIDVYCRPDFIQGIRFTRNFIENASGHVESCAKLLLEKLEPTTKTNKSLGALVYHLKNQPISKDLSTKLETFDNIAFKKAKHDWNVPQRPEVHLFNLDEAILIYFIARKLGRQIFEEGKLTPPE